MTYSIIHMILEGLEDEFKLSNNAIMAQWLHYYQEKKSVVITLKKTETLYSAIPPRTMISKMLIGLSAVKRAVLLC